MTHRKRSMQTQYVILNQGESYKVEDYHDPLLLSKKLDNLTKKIKSKNLIDDSSAIDYEKFQSSDLFQEYMQLCYQLKYIDLDMLLVETEEYPSDQNILAFFIINSDKKLDLTRSKDFWGKMAYVIGENEDIYTMDHIEHGILRANRPHGTKRMFAEDDTRLKLALKCIDPRIHFAINCGAKSCPKIAFYTHSIGYTNLEAGLDAATTNFITDDIKIDVDRRHVYISKLFLWYREDFIENYSTGRRRDIAKKAFHYTIIGKMLPGSGLLKKSTSIDKDDRIILKWITHRLKDTDERKIELFTMLNDEDKIKILYNDYNWEINIQNNTQTDREKFKGLSSAIRANVEVTDNKIEEHD